MTEKLNFNPEELETNKILLDLAIRDFENSYERKENLELKTEILLLFLSSLLAGYFTLYTIEKNYGILAAILILMMSSIPALYSIRIQKYETVDAIQLYKYFENDSFFPNQNVAIRKIIKTIGNQSNKNYNLIEISGQSLKLSLSLLGISMIILCLTMLQIIMSKGN